MNGGETDRPRTFRYQAAPPRVWLATLLLLGAASVCFVAYLALT